VSGRLVVSVPIPPLHTWLGVAAYTLLAEAAAYAEADGVEVAPGGPGPALRVWGVRARDYADALRDAVKNPPPNPCIRNNRPAPHPCIEPRGGRARLVRELPGFIQKYDTRYFASVAVSLCWRGDPASMTIPDLAEALASAIEGGCPTAARPVQPMLLARAEYYRFLRTLGGPTTSGAAYDAAKAMAIPAIAQAAGLLGHAWTGVYCTRGATVHVALDPHSRPGGLLRWDSDYFRAVAGLLEPAARVWKGAPPVRVAALAAAVAGACLRSLGAEPDPDSLLAASLGYGQTVTLHWVRPLAALAPMEALEAALRATGREALRLYQALASLLAAPLRPRQEEQAKAVEGIPGALVEYAGALVQHAEASWALGGRPRGLAYAAARAAEGYARRLARAGLAALARDMGVLAEAAGAAAAYEPLY
jgi:hypothetical protein